MKFARDYKETLEREEYPPEWVNSAISYKKLKKCIKRVQEELQSLGLDPTTLDHLWQHGSLSALSGQHEHSDRAMNYEFLSDGNIKFTPKLTIALDPNDGSPMDAWLSPETRRMLKKYGRRQSTQVDGIDHDIEHDEYRHAESKDIAHEHEENEVPGGEEEEVEEVEELKTVEVPLTSDSEFFQILRRELSNLQNLQEAEQKELEKQIRILGDGLHQLQVSKKKRKSTKEEIEAWREIFRIYTESEIFFSSHEVDAGNRDAAHAQRQLTHFDKTLKSQQDKKLKLTPEGAAALSKFMQINVDLLKLLKYQEINRLALTKIMKKFDKRTALHAQEGALIQINKSPFLTRDLARAACFTISDELLKIIPQLDDYLCPICFSISWKPIRLRCKHVFCIRCLIVMQRADQDKCPLCRENVVLEASSDNIDTELIDFLTKNFKSEVKEKQRLNEIAAGVDAFGEGYTGTHRCEVM